jgi:lysophospholipase L1-like esterase
VGGAGGGVAGTGGVVAGIGGRIGTGGTGTGGATTGGAGAPGRDAGAGRLTIYSIGDSTMADYDVVAFPDQRGWGQMFPQFIVDSTVHFSNAARNGRSSKSFYLEGLWAAVKALIVPGDYVLIQFAHNDEADGGIEGPGGIGTAAFGAFHDYLTRYVTETRALGGVPILVTPIVRRYFSGATLTPTGLHNLTGNGIAVGNADYVAAMKDVAALNSCPLIDMTTSTRALVEQYGPTNSKAIIYVPIDDTHLQPLGATLFAQLVVSEMIAKNILAPYLNPAADLVVSPTAFDFGSRYVSTVLDEPLSVTGLSLTPSAGNVTLTASAGFLVAAAAAGPFTPTLAIPYAGGTLSPTNVFVRFVPTAVQPYAGTLVAKPDGGNAKNIALVGTGLAAPAGVSESVVYPLTGDVTCSSATGFTTCAPESFSGSYVKNYQAVGTFPVSQRVSVLNTATPDSWPAEIDINPTRFVQFAVTPAAGRSFVVDGISVNAGAAGGNGMGFRVVYSKLADFSASTVLGNFPTNVSNTMTLLSFSPIVSLAAGETFYLRVYPWYNAVATAKYLCLQTLTIHGTAQ